MHLTTFLLLWFFASPLTAHAGQEVTIPKSMTKGYLAAPQVKSRRPAIIVMHEGLSPWLRRQADKLAELGYVALALDLGIANVAGTEGTPIPPAGSFAVIREAASQLRTLPFVSGNVGIIGWSSGATLALAAATAQSELKAVIMAYGSVPLETAVLLPLEVPLLGLFGADDGEVPERIVRGFAKSLLELEKNAKIKVYPKVGHDFMAEDDAESFDPTSAKLAWREIESFLKKTLR